MLWLIESEIKAIGPLQMVTVMNVVAHQIGHSYERCGVSNWSQLCMLWRAKLVTAMNVVAHQIGHTYECCGALNWSQL